LAQPGAGADGNAKTDINVSPGIQAALKGRSKQTARRLWRYRQHDR